MKQNKLLSVLFLLLVSCEHDHILETVAGKHCITDQSGIIRELDIDSIDYYYHNKGECSTGLTAKNSNKEIICVGQIHKSEEICDGLDNDCDLMIDEDFYNYPLIRNHNDPENICIGPGICQFAIQECVDGNWICKQHRVLYGKERCDGVDNDCDGLIDEDTQEEPIFSPEERYVYTGDLSTLNIGECRAGYKVCENGRPFVRNMRTPTIEICGNDDDDDCDGFVDESDEEVAVSDFVFIVDFSGSMSSTISVVSNALCTWSSQGTLRNSRFAVVAVGYYEDYRSMIYDDTNQIKVLTDFTDANMACQVLRDNIHSLSGGSELQLDALYHIHDINSEFYLSWSENIKKIIIFSDEVLQQTIFNNVEEALEIIIQQCSSEQHMVGAFVAYNVPDHHLWTRLTQSCVGFVDYLSQNYETMMQKLNYWIGSDC